MMIFTIFPQCGHLSLKTTSKALSRLTSSTLRLHTGHTPVSIIWLPFPVSRMPGKRVSNIFHPCYKVLPGFYFLYSFAIKKAAGFSAFPAALMYALFFFWFPYCRDKVVAFGAFRCDLHLSGGIRPYVQQTPAASWTSQLFHLVFIFFRNHFPPSFGCLCRKGTGQIIPVPFSFVAQGRGGSPAMPFFASPRHTAALPVTACRFHLSLSSLLPRTLLHR